MMMRMMTRMTMTMRMMMMMMMMMMSSELASGLRRWLNGLRGSPSAQPGTVIPSAQTATTPKTSSRSASSTSPSQSTVLMERPAGSFQHQPQTASRRVVNECFFNIQARRANLFFATSHSSKLLTNSRPPVTIGRLTGCVPGVIRVPKTELEHPSLATKAWH